MYRLFVLLCVFALLDCCTTTTVEPRKIDTGGSNSGGTSTSGTTGTTSDGDGSSTGGTGSTSGTGSGSGTTTTGGDDTCGLAEPNLDGLPIGAPCTEHEQCSTGYCYDESVFNEDGVLTYRFCTVACTSCGIKKTCGDWPKDQGTGTNKCYGLPTYYVNHYNLSYRSLCLVGCYKDVDCIGLDPFTKCAGLGIGKDKSYGSPDVCQPPEYVQLKDAF